MHTFKRKFAYPFRSRKFFSVFHAGVRQIAECPAVLNAQIWHKYRCEPLKTVSGPYLSSPDELESTCMRFRKRRSRLTTSQHISDACKTHTPSILRFCAPPSETQPSRSRTPPSPPQNTTANQYKSTEKYRKVQKMQVCHREARVELKYSAHHIRDGKISRYTLYRDFSRCPDRFPMVLGCFSSSFHDF